MSIADIAKQVKKEQKKIDRPLGEVFTDTLDSFISSHRSSTAREESFSLKPSSYYGCMRKTWYSLLRFPKSGTINAKSQRILEVGTALHEWVQRDILMLEGCPITLVPKEELPVKESNEVKFIKEHDAPEMELKLLDKRYTKKYPVSMMVDGIIHFDSKDMVFEFKTINPDGFKSLYEPLLEHKMQGALYCLCTGLRNIMFLYLEKGRQEWKAYHTEINEEQIEWVKNRLVEIENLVLSLSLPPKEENKYCRYCTYQKYCKKDYGGEQFDKNEAGFQIFLK